MTVVFVLLGVLGTLVSLALPVLIIILIVRAGRHGGALDDTPGAPVRRFFQYGLMFVALLLAAFGLDGLGRAAFEAEGLIGRGSARVASSLALLVVGAPLFGGLAMWTRRRMAADPNERRSIGWLLYITITLLTSLIVFMVAAGAAISAALRVRGAGGGAWVTAVVWGAIWAGHWVASVRQAPADESRSHRLLGSLVGLGAVVGLVITLGAIILTWAYHEAFSTTLVSDTSHDVRSWLGLLVVSAAVWWWYWLRTSRHQVATVGWDAYVLLGGVLVGLLIVVIAAGAVLYTVLGWLIGDAGVTSAGDHFAILPGALVAAAVGAGSWAYHRSIVHTRAGAGQDEVARIYVYLLAAVGLVASAAGVTTLLAALFDLISRPTVIGGDPTGRAALWGLTLIVIGVPLWWRAWAPVERSDAVEERTSLSRRLYLSGSFGLGGVFAVISLLGAVRVVLEDLIDGAMGTRTLYEVRVELALVITIGAVAAYHWRVFRADRALGAGPERLRRLLLVAGGDAGVLAAEISRRTGARVEVWRLGDDGHDAADPDAVVGALDPIDGSEAVVIVDGDGSVRALRARRLS